ncbi:hypothetical protein COU80_03640 [Candidatus Peregrinibacteria bacterium CG10_big_fil_rev_8_21_14_0_10_55_24]|nr:MAG: hypothetical protein COU80_03640 [Candidatus Peregrinibacteria bacterium CG10_big_fil_rev_8_21_14_0_10_55_24]
MQELRAFLVSATIVMSSAIIGLLLIANSAEAQSVGSLHIEQVSATRQMGTWVLVTPSGKTKTDSRGESSVTVSPIETGSYALTVQAPRRSYATIVVYRGREVVDSVDGTHLTFVVKSLADHRVVITYRFFGTISVESDPAGQAFVLKGSDTVSFSGVTPAEFKSVPPLYYTATFATKDGCQTPHNQRRLLEPNQEITFLGVYRCTFPAPVPTTPQVPENPVEERLALHLTTNTQEMLPEGVTRFTLSATNEGRRSVNDAQISIHFDPNQISVSDIADSGTLIGDSMIVWDIPFIYATQTWTTTFAAHANSTLQPGDRISVTARASAEGLVEDGATDQELTQTVGIVLLPQTGKTSDLLLGALISAITLLIATTIRRKYAVALLPVS